MEHWAQKCDGAGCPPEHIAVCKERDELKAAFDGAQLALKSLNERLVEVTAERDLLIESIKRGPPSDPCSLCNHNSVGLVCDGMDDCANCENRCPCGTCDLHASNFDFIGVKKEEKQMKHFIQVFGRQIELTEEQAKILQEQYAPPSVKLAEVPAGETFLIGSHEFVVLEQFEDSAAVILKGLLHDGMEFGKNNNFDGSGVDKACGKFADEIAEIIGSDNLLEHTVDLTSDDGLKDYGTVQRKLSLLTADLYRKYVEILDQYNLGRWWWLSTPYSTKRHDNESWVKCVSPSGGLSYVSYIGDYFGFRPFCILKSHIFVSK